MRDLICLMELAVKSVKYRISLKAEYIIFSYLIANLYI